MKALILTSSTGHGHVAAAEAMRDALMDCGGECETVDALSFAGTQTADIIKQTIVNIAVKTPRAFGFVYQAADAVSSDKYKSPVYYANSLYAEKLYAYIKEHHFDTALCPHLFPAEALTWLKKERGLKLASFYISTDYTRIPFLQELEMDRIFIPHEDLKYIFRDEGIPCDNMTAAGIPVSRAFRSSTAKEEARKRCGILQDVPAFLVMSGGEGGGDAVKVTQALVQIAQKDMRVLVLAGNNADLKEKIDKKFRGDIRVRALGFTQEVPQYMDACDVLITKPGGVTSTEAAVKGIPLIHVSPIPGVETENARFFSQRGMSVLAEDARDAAENALRLARDTKAAARMRTAQKQYVNPRAAEEICGNIAEMMKR